jgi:hypothetical protein
MLSMNSGVTFGMHQIFFPPRLDAPIREPFPERDGGDCLYFLVFDHFLLQEFKRPVIASFRGVAAGKGDQVRFGLLVEFRRLPGTRSIAEGAIDAAFGVSRTDTLDSSGGCANVLGDVHILHTGSAFQKNMRPFDFPDIVLSFPGDIV